MPIAKKKLAPKTSVLTMGELLTYLEKQEACDPALAYARTQTDPRIAWESCADVGWLEWICARLDLRLTASAWATYNAAMTSARATRDAAVAPAYRAAMPWKNVEKALLKAIHP